MIQYQELTGDNMKKKIMLVILSIFLMFLIACQQAAKTGTATTTTPTTGDAAVDSVGNNLNSTDNVAKDLGTDDLGSLDSSLSDVQNI